MSSRVSGLSRRVTDFGVVITLFVGLKAFFFDKRQADAFPPDFFLKAVAERCFNLFAEERDLASRKVYSPGKPLELTAKGKESEVVLTGQPGGDRAGSKADSFYLDMLSRLQLDFAGGFRGRAGEGEGLISLENLVGMHPR